MLPEFDRDRPPMLFGAKDPVLSALPEYVKASRLELSTGAVGIGFLVTGALSLIPITPEAECMRRIGMLG